MLYGGWNFKNVLRVTPLSSTNEQNILELDPQRIIGFLSFPNATNILIDGPPNHSVFTVKESLEEIKQQLSEQQFFPAIPLKFD